MSISNKKIIITFANAYTEAKKMKLKKKISDMVFALDENEHGISWL